MQVSKHPLCVLKVIIPGKKVWFPGDILEGVVEITSPGFNIASLRVTLEGRLRVWMYKRRPNSDDPFEDLVEHQFLKMECTPKWHTSMQNRDSHGLATYSLRFHFTIPQVLPISSTENMESSFQLLPPSFSGGSEFVDISSSKRYKQPLVIYAIQTSLALGPDTGNTSPHLLHKLDTMNEIQVLPRSGAQPPSAIEDFPGEFQMTSMRLIRRPTLWNRLVGDMVMSTREPSPIVLDTSAPRASSCCMISVIFTPANPRIGMGINLGPLRCRFKSKLHVKTYYSTRKFHQIPQKPKPKGLIQLRSEFVDLDTRDMLMPSWSPASPSVSTASLCLPINTPLDMTPTFTSTFAARLYALNLKIVLLDLCHEPFELEVPLQLVYRYPASCMS